jgi:hypothetical protein
MIFDGPSGLSGLPLIAEPHRVPLSARARKERAGQRRRGSRGDTSRRIEAASMIIDGTDRAREAEKIPATGQENARRRGPMIKTSRLTKHEE